MMHKILISLIIVIALGAAVLFWVVQPTLDAPIPSDTPALHEITATPQPTAIPFDLTPLSPVDDTRFHNIESLIQNDIDAGFPGAVLLVSQNDTIIYHQAFGNAQVYDQKTRLTAPSSMTVNTYFDLASLTKMYATTLAVMKLVDDGRLSLDTLVSSQLPAFQQPPYDQITLRHLLTHSAGFDSDIKFFRSDVEEGPAFYSRNRDKTLSLLAQAPLMYDLGTQQQYSDLGYMVLGAIVEANTGLRLDDYIRQYIYAPLGIDQSLLYTPLDHYIPVENIAATERMGNSRDGYVSFTGIRTYTLRGEVHDEKTYYSMDGVSGHAGLFGNTYALNLLNQVLLDGGEVNGIRLYSADTISQFLTIDPALRYQTAFRRANGFRSLSSIVSDQALCQTGWTGTFSLIDPQHQLSIILLTNKRHAPFNGEDFESAALTTGQYFPLVVEIYSALDLNP